MPPAPVGARGQRYWIEEKELRPPCISHCISQQLRLSPAVKCLVLPLQSSYCFWHFRNIGQRACLFSLVLRMAKCSLQVCEKYQPWVHGAACALERDISQSPSRPKGGFLTICLSNCSFLSHSLPTPTHPPTSSRPVSLPLSSSKTSRAFIFFPAVCREVSSEPPSVRQWLHFCFLGLLRHC